MSPVPLGSRCCARGRPSPAGAALSVLVAVVALVRGSGRIGAGAAPRLRPRGIRDSEEGKKLSEPASSDPSQLAQDPSEAALERGFRGGRRPSPGAPSDAEVVRDLQRLEALAAGRARAGGAIGLGRRGLARAPARIFPPPCRTSSRAAVRCATSPYRLGSSHGSFVDDAYDCWGRSATRSPPPGSSTRRLSVE